MPQAQRPGELCFPLAGRQSPRYGDQVLETMKVDGLRRSSENVPPRLRHENVFAEVLPEARDMALKRSRCIRRLLLAPQILDQPMRPNGLVRLQDEQREQCAPLPASHIDQSAVPPNVERSEDPKLEHVPTVTWPKPHKKL
jgi:hypothetical protein